MRLAALPALVALAAVTFAGLAAADPALDPAEVQKEWARRLVGRHYTATVHYAMPGIGDRRMTLRWDDSQRRERLQVRIEWPDEIRGQTWLMLENSARANDYFLYSTRRASVPVRRLRGVYKGNPFAGADFDYLGFRVAHPGNPVAKSVTPATVGDRKALLLTEEATDMPFDRREIWLDAESFVPLRGKFWRDGKVYLDVETEEVQRIQGVATPTQIRFTIPATDDKPERSTLWQVESIDYERPILESSFIPPR